MPTKIPTNKPDPTTLEDVEAQIAELRRQMEADLAKIRSELTKIKSALRDIHNELGEREDS
jgi:hypothetical protein